MATLLLAEHDNKALREATPKAVTAAKALGADVHLLVAGAGCRAVAEAAAKIDGVAKVLLADHPSFEHMLAVELWLSFLYGSYNGAMVVALTEVVPSHVRAAGFSLAYSLATTLGGSSLAISTWLIRTLDDKAAPGIWMTVAAVCGLLATLAIYQRKTPLAIEAVAAA